MTKAKMLTFQFACVINFFYVSHIERLCNSESLVNRLSDDSSWRGSKSANQRLYMIGGESPNKKWRHKAVFLGCSTFTWANRSVHGLANGKQNSVFENFIAESRLSFAQIYIIYRQLPRKQNKVFFTITEWILARWFVKSYGLWENRPWKWRNMSRSAGYFVFGFS